MTRCYENPQNPMGFIPGESEMNHLAGVNY